MACSVLHHGVADVQRHLRAVVEFQDGRSLENHFEVDGVGGVHARVRRIHVSHEAGQLGLEVGHRLLGVEEGLVFCGDVRWDGEQAEPKSADGRKVGVPLGHRTVIRKLRCLVSTPKLVEFCGGHQSRPVRLNGFVADEYGLSGRIVSGHHSAYTHRLSQPPSH